MISGLWLDNLCLLNREGGQNDGTDQHKWGSWGVKFQHALWDCAADYWDIQNKERQAMEESARVNKVKNDRANEKMLLPNKS